MILSANSHVFYCCWNGKHRWMVRHRFGRCATMPLFVQWSRDGVRIWIITDDRTPLIKCLKQLRSINAQIWISYYELMIRNWGIPYLASETNCVQCLSAKRTTDFRGRTPFCVSCVLLEIFQILPCSSGKSKSSKMLQIQFPRGAYQMGSTHSKVISTDSFALSSPRVLSQNFRLKVSLQPFVSTLYTLNAFNTFFFETFW